LLPNRSQISPLTKDLAADWKRWSMTERVSALGVIVLVLTAISIAALVRH
jgi:hypothetical protein